MVARMIAALRAQGDGELVGQRGLAGGGRPVDGDPQRVGGRDGPDRLGQPADELVAGALLHGCLSHGVSFSTARQAAVAGPRSTRTPLSNRAPARMSATRWGAVIARRRSWADWRARTRREGGGRAALAAGDLGAAFHRGEGRLDGIRGAQVDQMLRGEVVEGKEFVLNVGDLLDRLGPLRPVGPGEVLHGLGALGAVLGVVDLLQGLLCAGLRRLRERVHNVADLVDPAPLVAGCGEKPRRARSTSPSRCLRPPARGPSCRAAGQPKIRWTRAGPR